MSESSGRLHPSSIFFRLFPHARALLIPGLAVLLLSSGDDWQVWLMLIFVPSTVYELGQYFTLRYELRPDELVVRSGVLWRRERRIPIDRINSVDLTQGPLHRAFGVADVRVETAGGSEPEAVLRVLRLEQVKGLRASIFGEGHTAPAPHTHTDTADPDAPARASDPEPHGPPLAQLDLTELIKLGMVSMRGAAAAAIVIALAWEFNLFERIDISREINLFANHLDPLRLALVGALLLVGVPVLLLIISILWTIVRLHAFRLDERGDDLRLSCGLLTRHHATIPRRRIQLVSVISSPVHRLFDRVSIRVETAGGSAEHEEKKIIGQKWFVPLLPANQLDGLLSRVTRRGTLSGLDWQPLAPGAFARRAKLAVLTALLLTAFALLFTRPWGLLALPVFLPLTILHARADIRRTRYAVFEGGIAFRSGVITRRTTFTFFDKVQAVAVEESPFDRRRAMATLDVDTAGAGAAGHRIRVPYLERAVADKLYARLATGAGRTRMTV